MESHILSKKAADIDIFVSQEKKKQQPWISFGKTDTGVI